MALDLVIAPQAERDLDDIAAYISLTSEVAAYSELLRIERTVDGELGGIADDRLDVGSLDLLAS